jgi:hypothetical protein
MKPANKSAVATRSIFVDRDIDPEVHFLDTGLFDAFEIPTGIMILLDNMKDYGMQAVVVDKTATREAIISALDNSKHPDILGGTVPDRDDAETIADSIILLLQDIYPELRPVVIVTPTDHSVAAVAV